MIQRLLAREFTPERYGATIRKAMRRSAPKLKFNPDHYFPAMWNSMSNDLVAAWGGKSALLVAMFYPQIFTGEMVGVVSLWAGNGSPDAIPLLREFAVEARKRKCVSIHASSFGASRADTMARLYGRLGYVAEEVSYSKEL